MKPFQTARFNIENYHIITAIRLEAIMSSIDSGRALELVCQVVILFQELDTVAAVIRQHKQEKELTTNRETYNWKNECTNYRRPKISTNHHKL